MFDQRFLLQDPPANCIATLLCEVDGQLVRYPIPYRWTDEGWRSTLTGQRVNHPVEGWKVLHRDSPEAARMRRWLKVLRDRGAKPATD